MENPTNRNLLSRLIRLGLLGQIVLVIVLFGSGTLDFWQGWAFASVSLIITILFSACLYRRDRELLARRLIHKEKVGTQKVICSSSEIFPSSLTFCAVSTIASAGREFISSRSRPG